MLKSMTSKFLSGLALGTVSALMPTAAKVII